MSLLDSGTLETGSTEQQAADGSVMSIDQAFAIALKGDDKANEKASDDAPEQNTEEQTAESATEQKVTTDDLQEGQGETTEDGEEVNEETAPEIDPPAGWKGEEKELFSALPDFAKEAIVRREREREAYLTKRTQELADVEKKYRAINDALSPYRAEYSLAGFTDETAAAQGLAISRAIASDPHSAMQWIARTYGVQMPTQKTQSEDFGGVEDPGIQRLASKVQAIEQAVNGFGTLQQQAAAQLVAQQVEQFQTAKDASGALLRPHFETVRQRMGELSARLGTEDLEKLYRMALAERPELTAQEAQRKAAIDDLKRQQGRAVAAERAKGVASGAGVKTKAAAGPVRESVKTLDDALRMAFRAHGN